MSDYTLPPNGHSREEVTRRLLAVVTLGKRVAEVEKELRRLAGEAFDKVGQREVGTLEAGSLGTVQLDAGATTWAVTDERALFDYVEAKLGDAGIETVRRVRPATTEALRKMAAKRGAAVDDDGEPIPGLTCSTADAKVVVKAARDAADVLAQAFADGELALDDLAPTAIEGPR